MAGIFSAILQVILMLLHPSKRECYKWLLIFPALTGIIKLVPIIRTNHTASKVQAESCRSPNGAG